MESNRELKYQQDICQDYDFEVQMPLKWNLQLFFKSSYNTDKECFDKLASGSELNYGPCSEVETTTIKGVAVS